MCEKIIAETQGALQEACQKLCVDTSKVSVLKNETNIKNDHRISRPRTTTDNISAAVLVTIKEENRMGKQPIHKPICLLD